MLLCHLNLLKRSRSSEGEGQYSGQSNENLQSTEIVFLSVYYADGTSSNERHSCLVLKTVKRRSNFQN